jgi:undecaprenyl-diphosphatase
MFEQWNLTLFDWINVASNHPPSFLLYFAQFSAEILIYLLAVWMIYGWIRKGTNFRVALLVSTLAAVIGLLINQAIGLFWYHPRPFEMGVGHSLMKHVAESSFPSDHAVVFFSIGLSLLAIKHTRQWGIIISLLAILVAWSRVYLGVHFPFDMIGSFVVSLVAIIISLRMAPIIETKIEPALAQLYEKIVVVLHLPESLFPTER